MARPCDHGSSGRWGEGPSGLPHRRKSMARKITASLYMTLDGRGAFPKYPGSDRENTEANEMWREMWLNRFDDVTTVIMGRRSFLGHRRVWTEKARKPT